MKIALIGAGSFVFAPTFCHDLLVRHRPAALHLILVDLDLAAAERMARLARSMAVRSGLDARIEAAMDRVAALEGADYVGLCASPQGAARWRMDFEILREAGLADQARECGGLGGLANSLRSITLALDLAREIQRRSPKAVLLDVTNPMPRVVTAVNRFTQVACYGFCNIAQEGTQPFAESAGLLGLKPVEISGVTAGLNHFAWALSLQHRASGEDLLPALRVALERRGSRTDRLRLKWWREWGLPPFGHVDHHGEYLPKAPDIQYPEAPPYHGTPAERQRQARELECLIAGACAWEEADICRSWEHPSDFLLARENPEAVPFPILNLPNDGTLPQLPRGRIVEIPVRVGGGRVGGGGPLTFPPGLAALLLQLSDVHEKVAAGAAEGNPARLLEAIEIDPAIEEKAKAKGLLEKLLARHRDLLPQF
ncbi:MAG: hypothetical protein HYV36_03400 [Lentisphaerae bacterium]|nr:hypothetical protein [Lentisphaerota bacterium]